MIELSDFERKIQEHSLLTAGHGQHAARSALRHLERARALAKSMPEVAVFLGITAEEESSTAVFYSLQRRKYKGSNRINPRDHVQKTALHPFLLGVGRAIREFTEPRRPSLVFDTENSPDKSELLRIRVQVSDASGALRFAMPLPPLHFSISSNGAPHDFSEELATLATEKGAKQILAYVSALAKRRNKVLYASSNGIPHAEGVEEFLQYRRSVVFSHLMVYLLIDQHRQQQLFAQQCLDAFLKMLGRFPDDA